MELFWGKVQKFIYRNFFYLEGIGSFKQYWNYSFLQAFSQFFSGLLYFKPQDIYKLLEERILVEEQ
jgi:hypothetical protein